MAPQQRKKVREAAHIDSPRCPFPEARKRGRCSITRLLGLVPNGHMLQRRYLPGVCLRAVHVQLRGLRAWLLFPICNRSMRLLPSEPGRVIRPGSPSFSDSFPQHLAHSAIPFPPSPSTDPHADDTAIPRQARGHHSPRLRGAARGRGDRPAGGAGAAREHQHQLQEQQRHGSLWWTLAATSASSRASTVVLLPVEHQRRCPG